MSTALEIIGMAIDDHIEEEIKAATTPLKTENAALTKENATLKAANTAQATEIAALKAEIERLKAGGVVAPPEDPTPPPDEEPSEPETPPVPTGANILFQRDEIMKRPTDVEDFKRIKATADKPMPAAKLDNNAELDEWVQANAIVAVRLNDARYRQRTIDGLVAIQSAPYDETLSLGRNLFGHVVAADLIDYADKKFVDWVYRSMTQVFTGSRTHSGLPTIVAVAVELNSNWATECRRSVVGASMYLMKRGDAAQKSKATEWLRLAVLAHKRDIGEPGDYRDLPPLKSAPTGWFGNSDPIVGINPRGTTQTIQGKVRYVGGLRGADARRAKKPGGGDDVEAEYWPPQTVYHWAGLTPQTVTAMVLHIHGLCPFDAGDDAIVRAHDAQYGKGESAKNEPSLINPAAGDDKSAPIITRKLGGPKAAYLPLDIDDDPDKSGTAWMRWYLFGGAASTEKAA